MKILVTGANGYLGLGICKKLLDDGHEVVATDINVDKCDVRSKNIACDIFSVDDPFGFFGCPDVLLHLAWRDGFVHDSENHIIDLPEHHNFLLKFFKSDIKRIAVMGTMHEIGFYEGSIDENTSCNPMNLYGIAKNALRSDVERMSKLYNKPFQWLRGFYIVANTIYGASVFSKMSKAAAEGKKNFPFTTGLNQYDFLDYEQFCKRTALTVEQNKILGIINICSGRPEKLADRVEKFILENKLNIKLQYGVYPDRAYDSKAVWGNSNKIDEILCIRSVDNESI